MAQDIVYTLGVIIAILLLLFFLRSILIRRQRIAAAHATALQFPAPTNWAFHSDRGMDVVRPEPAVTNWPPPPRPSFTRTHTADSSQDQLPRYEAPPPLYDAIVKDIETERAESLRRSNEERGEASSGVASGLLPPLPPSPSQSQSQSPLQVPPPPGYERVSRDEVLIPVRETSIPVPQQQQPRGTLPPGGGLFNVDLRRAWGRGRF